MKDVKHLNIFVHLFYNKMEDIGLNKKIFFLSNLLTKKPANFEIDSYTLLTDPLVLAPGLYNQLADCMFKLTAFYTLSINLLV